MCYFITNASNLGDWPLWYTLQQPILHRTPLGQSHIDIAGNWFNISQKTESTITRMRWMPRSSASISLVQQTPICSILEYICTPTAVQPCQLPCTKRSKRVFSLRLYTAVLPTAEQKKLLPVSQQRWVTTFRYLLFVTHFNILCCCITRLVYV